MLRPGGGLLITGSSGTLPAHAAGDLLVIMAIKWDSASPTPSVPSGWTSAHTATNISRRVVGWRIATAAGTASGTWTNAEALFVSVWPNATIGAVASAASATNSAGTPALTLTRPGEAWVALMGSTDSTALPSLPTGMVERLRASSPDVRDLYADTNGPVASWPSQTGTYEAVVVFEVIPTTTPVEVDVTTSWEVAGPVEVDVTTSWEVTPWWIDTDVTTSWAVDAMVNADVTTSWVVEGIETWRDLIASPAWLEAIAGRVRDVVTRVIVVDQTHQPVTVTDAAGEPLGDVPIVSGEVTMRGESDEVWSCRLTISDPRWVPRSPADPLHPASPYRLAIYWRLRLASGRWAEIPLGIYRTGRPTIDALGRTSITGSDVVRVAKGGGYRGHVVDVGGLTVDVALRKLFAICAPTLPFECEPSTVTLPAVFELGRRKPSEDWPEIAALDGMVVRADREGTLRSRRPTTSGITRMSLVEGPDCPMADASRDLSDTIYNVVTVEGTHPDLTEPVYGIAINDDPTSPTSVGRIGVSELQISSDAVSSVEAATAMAQLHLGRHGAPAESVRVQIQPRPDLEYRDLIDATRRRTGIAGAYETSSWTLPLPVAGQPPALQSVEFMSRQETY